MMRLLCGGTGSAGMWVALPVEGGRAGDIGIHIMFLISCNWTYLAYGYGLAVLGLVIDGACMLKMKSGDPHNLAPFLE